MRKMFTVLFVLTALSVSHAWAATQAELTALFAQVAAAPSPLFVERRTGRGWFIFSFEGENETYSFGLHRYGLRQEIEITIMPIGAVHEIKDYVADRDADGIVDDGLDKGAGLLFAFHQDPYGREVPQGIEFKPAWQDRFDRAIRALQRKLAPPPAPPVP